VNFTLILNGQELEVHGSLPPHSIRARPCSVNRLISKSDWLAYQRLA
jgi:hypothetical protein